MYQLMMVHFASLAKDNFMYSSNHWCFKCVLYLSPGIKPNDKTKEFFSASIL